jgi:hypothetical protein
VPVRVAVGLVTGVPQVVVGWSSAPGVLPSSGVIVPRCRRVVAGVRFGGVL